VCEISEFWLFLHSKYYVNNVCNWLGFWGLHPPNRYRGFAPGPRWRLPLPRLPVLQSPNANSWCQSQDTFCPYFCVLHPILLISIGPDSRISHHLTFPRSSAVLFFVGYPPSACRRTPHTKCPVPYSRPIISQSCTWHRAAAVSFQPTRDYHGILFHNGAENRCIISSLVGELKRTRWQPVCVIYPQSSRTMQSPVRLIPSLFPVNFASAAADFVRKSRRPVTVVWRRCAANAALNGCHVNSG